VRDESEPPSTGSVVVRTLRAPTRAEIERLAEIFDRYRVHYGEAAEASRTESWLEGNIRSGRLEAFVAEDDGAFVGFAFVVTVPASLRLGHFWQIRDLFVLPNHRRLGVGRALLDFISEAAYGAGASRLALQTEVDNIPALRLYAGSGYTAVEGYCALTLQLKPDSRKL
jgi:GNAT superfamily N-acetyltransferase